MNEQTHTTEETIPNKETQPEVNQNPNAEQTTPEASGGTSGETKPEQIDNFAQMYDMLKERDETIKKLTAHNYETVVTEPNCTERGYTTYTCECGHSYVGDYVDISHKSTKQYERVITKPTCAEDGSKEVITSCSDCKTAVGRETVIIPALGHTPEDAVEENYVAPTCTATGSKEISVCCSVCDEEISCETVVIEATGHSYNEGEVTTAANCTMAGVKTYTCGKCSHSYTEEIAPLDHRWNEGEITTAPPEPQK